MSKSSWPKEKYGKSDEPSQYKNDEGTAARTRPLSFEEIMLRRKDKKLAEDLKEGVVEAVEVPGDSIGERLSDHFKSDRGYRMNKHSDHFESDRGYRMNKHTSSEDKKRVLEEKLNSRKIEEKTLMKGNSSTKRKDREPRKLQTKLRSKIIKDGNSKSEDESEKQSHGRRKIEDRSGDDFDNEVAKTRSRDLIGKDTHGSRSRDLHEREGKRKYRNGDDEKSRDRKASKNHDLGKGRDSKVSERKERKESSKPHCEESTVNRRRSRSRERREDRNRRSISPPPRSHNNMSSHSLKLRSGRHQTDVERSRITSNGSNSQYKHHGGSTSRLGGYSPRKRRTEAAARTPSPTIRSPEKKTAKWDLAPEITGKILSVSASSTLQSSNQSASSNVREVVGAISIASTTVTPIVVASPVVLLAQKHVSLDSVQLTQATRPMRRLYVENLPVSTSEKALMDCLNDFLRPLVVNHIQGAQPCISCIIHREKGQALVEFLSPEHASAALSFDGTCFSGSILKIRRPKDFVEVATGDLEKSVAVADTISDIVKDSPYKIFIGGISKVLSSEMLMEIASAFGRLKAYHFEENDDITEPYAFLEYADQSVTLKACAGLNGMKLGGKVITAVHAVSNASSLESNGNSSFRGIPEHAKPLLEKPTQVIKLKNLFNLEGLSSLPELEVEETLEDVRLECARFGAVKSVNLVKHIGSDRDIATLRAYKVHQNIESDAASQNLASLVTNEMSENLEEVINHHLREVSVVDFSDYLQEVKEVDNTVVSNSNPDDELAGDFSEDKPNNAGQIDIHSVGQDTAHESASVPFSHERCLSLGTPKDNIDNPDPGAADNDEIKEARVGNKMTIKEELNSEEVNGKLRDSSSGGSDGSLGKESDANENAEQNCDLGQIFEPGCVFVEYKRTEASCMAAHCLHGRLYDDRIVSVEYVPLDLYQARFLK